MTWCIHATWDDVPHLTAAQKAKMWADVPEHEREARTTGVPVLGSGRVFTVAEQEIKIQPFAIPPHWPQIIGIDFGWDHPFAAARMAWDRESDTVYVTHTYQQRLTTPVIHAATIKAWGDWIPVAWPHDGLQHDKGSGKQLAQLYRDQGLKLIADHATHPEGGNGVEAGIMDMLDRMQTGRWKVFSTCGGWFENYRLYHRDKGKIEKKNDDEIDASRTGLMMLRHARVKPKADTWKHSDIAGVV